MNNFHATPKYWDFGAGSGLIQLLRESMRICFPSRRRMKRKNEHSESANLRQGSCNPNSNIGLTSSRITIEI